MAVEILTARPGQDRRPELLRRLLATPRPLYLAAGRALLRRSIRELGRLAGGAGTGAREHAHLLHRFIERAFTRAHRDWRRIDATEQRLIMGRLIRQTALPTLGPIAGKPGLTAAALRFVRELKETGRPLSDWLPRLRAGKEAELGQLAAAYDQYLTSRRLADPQDVARMGAAALAAGGPDQWELAVIDGFATLTGLEQAAIAALAGCARQVVVLVTHDPDRPELFAPVAEDLARWWPPAAAGPAGDSPEAESLAGDSPEAAPTALAHLRRWLFHPRPQRRAESAGIELVAAAGPQREVREVARRIKQLLATGRFLPEDIAVVASQPDPYADPVRHIFAEYGIPVDVLPAPLHAAPVAQAVLALLDLAGGAPWRRDQVLNLLRNPYLPWSGAPLARLAEALAPLPPAALPDEWAAALSQQRDGAALARPLRELAEALRPFGLPASMADHSRALRATLARLQVGRRILALTGQSGELTGPAAARAGRELTAFRAVTRTLERLALAESEVGAGDPLSAGEFRQLLQGELAEQRYQPAAAAPGSRVRFLVPAQTEGLQAPAVFILGLAEGLLPAARADDWVLSEARRQELGLPTWERHQARERLNFLRAITLAGEQLVIARPSATDEGEEWLPSGFWHEVAACFDPAPALHPVPLSQVLPPGLAQVSSAGELQVRLAAVAWGGAAPAAEADAARRLHRMPGLLDPAAWEQMTRRIGVEQRRWAAGFSRWDGRLEDPAIRQQVAERFGPERAFSASALESYAFCGFRFFGERVLGLQPADEYEADVAPDEQGSLLHAILARFFREWGRRPLAAEPARALLEQVAAAELAAGLARFHPTLRAARLRQWQGWLQAWLAHELALQERTGAALLPTYFEVSFGQPALEGTDPHSTEQPVELAPGYRFRGVVDRIDTDDQGRYLIYDYKSGRAPQRRDIAAGLKLQLPIYLAAVARLGLPLAASPAGGAYYGLRDFKRTGVWEKAQAQLTGGWDGIAAEDLDAVLAQMEVQVRGLIDRLRDGRFEVHPQQDPCPAYCAMRDVCRIDRTRLALKAAGNGGSGPAAATGSDEEGMA